VSVRELPPCGITRATLLTTIYFLEPSIVFRRTYQLRPEVLAELQTIGVNEAGIKFLRGVGAQRAMRREELEQRLQDAGPKVLAPDEREAVLKYSRISLLRLERVIPQRSMREWVEALIFAAAIALFVRTFLFAPFTIPSGSMLPTIQVGDYIFATKYDYGIPIPFTDTKLLASEVKRGDIVIFPKPGDPSDSYIKRVIAVGGETLELRGIQIYINGQPLDEPYAFYDPAMVALYRSNGREPPGFGPVTVPPGSLFMMGDNRFNSQDSRYWGTLEAHKVIGRGRIVWWSHDPRESLLSGYALGRVGRVLR